MAYERLGITIDFDAESNKVDKTIAGMEHNIRLLKNDIKALNSEFKLSGDSSILNKKLENLQEQYKGAAKLVEFWSSKFNELKSEGAKQSEINQAQNNLIKAQKTLVDIEVQIKNLKEQMGLVVNQTEKFGEKLIDAGDKISDVGDKIEKLGKYLTPLSNTASKITKESLELSVSYESALANLKRTLDSTGKSQEEFDGFVDELDSKIRELSKSIPASADEIANITALMAQLGVEDKDLMKFTEVMIDLGKTTNLSAEQAGESIAKFYNIVGGDMDTVDRFASTLLVLGVRAAATESEVTDMAFRIGAAGNRVRMTESQILALSTALASVGLEAQGGGSAISQVITNIDKDVDSNAERLSEWAKISNMTIEEFKKAWKEDAADALNSVIVGMADVIASGGNLNTVLDDLDITAIRQLDAMGRLAGQQDSLSKYIDIANEAWEENSGLADATAIIYDTLESKIQVMKNTFDELKREIGEALSPTIETANEKLKEMAEWFLSLPQETKETIAKLISLTAIIAPLLLAFGKITKSVGGMVSNFGDFIKDSVAPLTKNFYLLKESGATTFQALQTMGEGAINGITSAIGGFLSNPVALLIAGLVVLIATNKELRDFLKDKLLVIFEALKDLIQNSVVPILKTLWDWLSKYIIPVFRSLWDLLNVLVITMFEALWEIIKDVVAIASALWEGIKELWDVFSQTTAGQIIISVFENVKKAIESLFGWITTLISGFDSLINKAKALMGLSFNNRSLIDNASRYVNSLAPRAVIQGGYNSGGFGDIVLNNTINVNNNGANISQGDVQAWGKQIANVVDIELGRRLGYGL